MIDQEIKETGVPHRCSMIIEIKGAFDTRQLCKESLEQIESSIVTRVNNFNSTANSGAIVISGIASEIFMPDGDDNAGD